MKTPYPKGFPKASPWPEDGAVSPSPQWQWHNCRWNGERYRSRRELLLAKGLAAELDQVLDKLRLYLSA